MWLLIKTSTDYPQLVAPGSPPRSRFRADAEPSPCLSRPTPPLLPVHRRCLCCLLHFLSEWRRSVGLGQGQTVWLQEEAEPTPGGPRGSPESGRAPGAELGEEGGSGGVEGEERGEGYGGDCCCSSTQSEMGVDGESGWRVLMTSQAAARLPALSRPVCLTAVAPTKLMSVTSEAPPDSRGMGWTRKCSNMSNMDWNQRCCTRH